jgi:DNA-binding CsgD family transcriptional regulator
MLHGRAEELATLTTVVESARSGRAAAIVVRGEAGVGKSALVDELTGQSEDVQVLRTRGVESEVDFAFGGLYELLRPAMPRIRRLPPGQASAMRTAFGLEAGAVTEPLLVSVGALSLIAELAEETPVLCVVDDAHWLDPVSATAFAFVARRLQAERVAMVFTVRDGEEHRIDTAGINELQLNRLDATASRDLLRSRFPHIASAVADRLIGNTLGNPLALVEMAGSLSERQLQGSIGLPDRIPAIGSLSDAFLARARRLSEAAQRLLLVIAIDDTGNLRTVLESARRLNIPPEVLDETEATRLVDIEDALVRFHHPLIRSAVLHGSSRPEQREAHKALAATYRAAGDLERASFQLFAATEGMDETVAAELEEAAIPARRRGGFEAASRALEHSAALTPDPARRSQRLLVAAEDAWTAGLIDRTRRLVEASRALTDETSIPTELIRLQAWTELNEGSVPTAREILWESARETLSTDPDISLEMAAAAAETAWVYSDFDALREMGSSLQVFEPLVCSSSYHSLLLTGFIAHAHGDRLGGTAALAEATRLAEDQDDNDLLNSAGHVAFYTGDDSAAHRINTKVAARARAAGSIGLLIYALQRQAPAEILNGRLALAAATLEEAGGLAQTIGRQSLLALTTTWQAYLSAVRGTDGFKSLITEAQDHIGTRTLGALRPLFDSVASWAQATQEALDDRPASAFQRLRSIDHPAIKTMAAFDLVDLGFRAGQSQEAMRAIDSLESLASVGGAGWASTLAAYGRALMSEEDAEPHLRQALEVSGPNQRPFDIARIRLALGIHLRRNRRRMEARPHLEEALASFESMGTRPWAEQASRELRASGKTARARDPSTIFDLTPQELQVARFVSQGLTNREVAERLFLSPRTVDYHLRKIFVKLGITSRSRLSQFSFD